MTKKKLLRRHAVLVVDIDDIELKVFMVDILLCPMIQIIL